MKDGENMQKRNRAYRINEMLEIPKEISTNEPKVTIIGFNEMLIENYKNILEYEEFFIKINTYMGVISINGFNLNLKQMTEDDIVVSGKIESIDFESITDDN